MAKQIIRHLEFYGFPDQNVFISEPCVDSCIDKKQDWEIHKLGHDLYAFRHFQHGFNDKTIEINNAQNKKINEITDATNELTNDVTAISGTVDDILEAIGGTPVPTIKEEVDEVSGKVEAFSAETNDKFDAVDEELNSINDSIESFSGEFLTYTAATNEYIENYIETADSKYAHQDNTYTKEEVDALISGGTDDMATKSWVIEQDYATNEALNAFSDNVMDEFDNKENEINTLQTNLDLLSATTDTKFITFNNKLQAISGVVDNMAATADTRLDELEAWKIEAGTDIANLQIGLASKADASALTQVQNVLDSKVNNSDYQVFTASTEGRFTSVETSISNIHTSMSSKAEIAYVDSKVLDEKNERVAADDAINNSITSITDDIITIQGHDSNQDASIATLNANLTQEIQDRTDGDLALIGQSTDGVTANTINGAKAFATQQMNSAKAYADSVKLDAISQADSYTDAQIAIYDAKISALAKTEDVINRDNELRADYIQKDADNFATLNGLITAEANRAGGVETSLRNDINSLGDSLNSVDNLVHKITDWDGTGTYTGSGNGAMDIMHQELHNLITQFNGLIATLTQKGILP